LDKQHTRNGKYSCCVIVNAESGNQCPKQSVKLIDGKHICTQHLKLYNVQTSVCQLVTPTENDVYTVSNAANYHVSNNGSKTYHTLINKYYLDWSDQDTDVSITLETNSVITKMVHCLDNQYPAVRILTQISGKYYLMLPKDIRSKIYKSFKLLDGSNKRKFHVYFLVVNSLMYTQYSNIVFIH
jgi:hypothetical protein